MAYEYFHQPLAKILHRSLLEDAFYITMEASVPGGDLAAREAMWRYMDYSMKEGQEFGFLQLPEEGSYGASIWSKPLATPLAAEKERRKKAFLSENMGPSSLETYERIVRFMSAKSEEWVAPDSWYLSILAIAPDRQGQGLGRTLVSPVLEEADALGLATYLETFNPRNKTFYNRLGYEDAAIIEEPTTGAEYSLMIRPPAR